MKTNIRDLEGVLIRVVAHALLEGKKKASIDSAKKALEEGFDRSNQGSPQLRTAKLRVKYDECAKELCFDLMSGQEENIRGA